MRKGGFCGLTPRLPFQIKLLFWKNKKARRRRCAALHAWDQPNILLLQGLETKLQGNPREKRRPVRDFVKKPGGTMWLV
jgi:hypothetical protein